MERFQTLGREIEDIWRDANYDEEKFPAIAAEALLSAELPSKVTAWQVIEWTLAQRELPPQKDPAGNFGDPPITLFVSPRFYIDVYFWLEGTTAIHQHGFCGAFQVLHGSSIHSWYDFTPHERINTFTETGEMSLKVCELFSVGDVQQIYAGRRYIHSLFHLDQPSATIVVRTEKSPMYLPQYSYEKPGLAIDPFFDHQTTTRKLQSLAALYKIDHPDAEAETMKLLASSDFQTTFRILESVRGFFTARPLDEVFKLTDRSRERFRNLLDAARERHGEKVDVLAAVFAHRDMSDEIVRLRHSVTNADHRFFLALLLNLEGTGQIFPLIKQRFPDDEPLDKALDWIYELAQTRIVGTNLPNALGIEFDDIDLIILEHLLEGKDDGSILDELAGTGNARLDNLESRIVRIREAVIFRPLLCKGEMGAS
jgi:hypothetical protein